MASRPLRVGTRSSALARHQTDTIIAMLTARAPECQFEVVPLVTEGDRFAETPIAELGEALDKGIFNSALEEAVLSGEVDFATCSFKDVESTLPGGLVALTVGAREEPRDVLITRHKLPLSKLPPGAVLATSSPRRASQLLRFRPDFSITPLRGNVNTRVEREAARFDGVILAAAGVRRLGLEAHIQQVLPVELMLPAPAQGALGCQFSLAREDIANLLRTICRAETEACVNAEKRLLTALSGGCFAPVGALATLENDVITLRARVVSPDGKRTVEDALDAPAGQWLELAEQLAQRMRAQGASEVIAETRAGLLASGTDPS